MSAVTPRQDRTSTAIPATGAVVAPGLIETNITRRHYLREDGTVDEARREAALAPIRSRPGLSLTKVEPSLEDVFISLMQTATQQ